MEFLKVLILAVVQGIAEFLPVSSSGHLMVLGRWFGFDPEANLLLNVILHAGTLVAILGFYAVTLWRLLVEPQRRRVIWLVALSTVPTALIGLGVKRCGLDEWLFGSLWVPAVGFLITGTLLKFALPKGDCGADGLPLERFSWGRGLLVGIVQGIAVTPGISRSGSTIAAGLRLGLRNRDAAEFSFLLAIPAIGGAALLEGCDAIRAGALRALDHAELLNLGIGFLVAAVVGYGSLAVLLKILQRGKLVYFAYYVYAAAAVVAATELVKLF